MTNDDDFSHLSDPEFLAERRRVREELQRSQDRDIPAPSASDRSALQHGASDPSACEHGEWAELAIRYDRLNEEFLRRAAAAWKGAK